MKLNQMIVLDTLATKVYKKCGLCGAIRNLCYRMTVKDAQTGQMVVGSLLLCSKCGNNFGDLIGRPHPVPQKRTVNL